MPLLQYEKGNLFVWVVHAEGFWLREAYLREDVAAARVEQLKLSLPGVVVFMAKVKVLDA